MELYHRMRAGEVPTGWQEDLRLVALAAREGRLPPLSWPGERVHDLLRTVLGNLPWTGTGEVLQRLEDLLTLHSQESLAALHFGCCLRPSAAAAALPPERLRRFLAGLEARRGGDSADRSVALWREHGSMLLGEAAPSAALEAGLALARGDRSHPRERARASLGRECSMWDSGSRLAQALAFLDLLEADQQADLLVARMDVLLRGFRDSGEPGLILAWRGAPPARAEALERYWGEVLRRHPDLAGLVAQSRAGWLRG